MARADVRSRGHRARKRRFNGYLEKVMRLAHEGRSVSTIATVTRTDEQLVKDTLRLIARSGAVNETNEGI